MARMPLASPWCASRQRAPQGAKGSQSSSPAVWVAVPGGDRARLARCSDMPPNTRVPLRAALYARLVVLGVGAACCCYLYPLSLTYSPVAALEARPRGL